MRFLSLRRWCFFIFLWRIVINFGSTSLSTASLRPGSSTGVTESLTSGTSFLSARPGTVVGRSNCVEFESGSIMDFFTTALYQSAGSWQPTERCWWRRWSGTSLVQTADGGLHAYFVSDTGSSCRGTPGANDVELVELYVSAAATENVQNNSLITKDPFWRRRKHFCDRSRQVLQWFIQTPQGVITPSPQFSCDTPNHLKFKGGVYGGCLCDRDGRGNKRRQILTWTNLFTLWNK